MSEEPSPLRVVATQEDDGARADVVLSRHHPQLSRRVAKQLALEGKLRIDGAKAKPSQRVEPGVTLELRMPAAEHAAIDLALLHESEDFIYIHKPSGLHTVALRPDEPGCLATAVAKAYPYTRDASEDPRESGAVHRLDHATSGVVAFAKTREAWLAARALFDRREVVKDYMARSAGTWPPVAPEGSLPSWLEPFEAPSALPGLAVDGDEAFRIRAALGRGEVRRSVAVRLDGQRATTIAQKVVSAESLCLRLRLVTGQRHQARVHLAWIGLPIDGDELYGGREAPRLMLHATKLGLSHPTSGESMIFESPCPS